MLDMTSPQPVSTSCARVTKLPGPSAGETADAQFLSSDAQFQLSEFDND